MPKQCKVVVGPSVNLEIEMLPLPEQSGHKIECEHDYNIGGTSFNVVSALTVFGIDAHLIAALGQDDPTNGVVTTLLDEKNISYTVLGARKRSCIAVINTAERKLFSGKSPQTTRVINTCEGQIEDAISFHFPTFQVATGVTNDPGEVEMAKVLLSHCGSPKAVRVLNPRQSLARNQDLFKSLLKSTDILVLNEHEAAAFLNRTTADIRQSTLEKLAQHGPHTVILTRGGQPVISLCESGRTTGVSPLPQNISGRIVEEQGAGDCLLGFYLGGLLTGRNHNEALNLAMVAASLKVRRPHTNEFPSLQEIDEHMLV